VSNRERPDLLFSRPALTDDDINEVLATLRSGWLTTGPRVHAFEQRFAEYAGAKHAVAVNSCTAALHLSLLACGIGPGDEVITTPLTFCATANAIIHTGATPVFADVDRATGNIDPAAMAAAISPRTRALLPVHYAGRPGDVDAHRALADAHGLRVIEDAAHCVEGSVRGRKIGATGDLTCFSFYATKNLTTGEGGMLTTDSDEWARFARTASLHGLSKDAWARYSSTAPTAYEVEMPGFKYNMMDIQAALGLHQLDRLDASLQRRQAICRAYDEGFADLPIVLPHPVSSGVVHARHLYTVLVDPATTGITRDELRVALQQRGIGTSVHFHALHLHHYYARRFGLARGRFPNAEFISDRTVSLPLSLAMTDADVARVIDAVRGAIAARVHVGHAA
jgi:dTDP-4-amino-4,6-dideoxygalactose transaminase